MMAAFVEPSLLAPALRNDLNMRALETLSARLSALDLSPTVLYDFDHVEASALIHLAEQFNVLGDAGWDMANTEAKKRALLKEAIALHRIKGTPYALKRAMTLLGIDPQVTEWFESVPAGAPYTFNLDAKVVDWPAGEVAIDAVKTEKIRRVASFWKPARSHFTLRVGLGMSTDLRVASVFGATQVLVSAGALQ